mgnify:CR=1 FL=1
MSVISLADGGQLQVAVLKGRWVRIMPRTERLEAWRRLGWLRTGQPPDRGCADPCAGAGIRRIGQVGVYPDAGGLFHPDERHEIQRYVCQGQQVEALHPAEKILLLAHGQINIEKWRYPVACCA